jgi:hypothetical protein
LAITFFALDIKVKEQSDENLARGRKVFEPPRFMTCQQAAQQLLSAVQVRVRKNPVYKKNQPSGCFCFFWVFLFICPEERVFRVFSVSRILLGASRL